MKFRTGQIIQAVSTAGATVGCYYLVEVTTIDREGIHGRFHVYRDGLPTKKSPEGYFPWASYTFSQPSDEAVAETVVLNDVVKWLQSMPKALREKIKDGRFNG